MKKSETKDKPLATTNLAKIDVMCQERKRHSRGVIRGIEKEYSVEDIKAEIVSEAKVFGSKTTQEVEQGIEKIRRQFCSDGYFRKYVFA